MITLQGVGTTRRAGVCSGRGVDRAGVWEAACFSAGDRAFDGDAGEDGGLLITTRGLRGFSDGVAPMARPTAPWPSGVVGLC